MDLRRYLQELAVRSPASVERFTEAADWQRQPEAESAALADQERWPVLHWESPGSALAGVVTNLFADRARIAAWYGAEPWQVSPELRRRLHERAVPVEAVEASKAPVRQVVRQGSEVDLNAYQAPHHSVGEHTAITSALLIYRDPNDGAERICQQLALRTSPSTLALPLDHHSRLTLAADACRRRGEAIPAALWIGHHPAVLLAAACVGSEPQVWDRLGALVGEMFGVVDSLSAGAGLRVPAAAEMICEGSIDAAIGMVPGGFPAGNGFQALEGPALTMQVTHVSQRREALWCDAVPDQRDGYNAAGIPLEVALLETVGRQAPSLLNARVPWTAAGLHVYLQLEKPRKGEAREALLTAFAVDARIKHVFVVDDDVDIFDDREVLWALATRTQWERDAVVLPALRGSRLDTMADGAAAAKGGFDCTMPAGEAFSERNAVTHSVMSEVRLEDYIDAEHLRRIPVERQ